MVIRLRPFMNTSTSPHLTSLPPSLPVPPLQPRHMKNNSSHLISVPCAGSWWHEGEATRLTPPSRALTRFFASAWRGSRRRTRHSTRPTRYHLGRKCCPRSIFKIRVQTVVIFTATTAASSSSDEIILFTGDHISEVFFFRESYE